MDASRGIHDGGIVHPERSKFAGHMAPRLIDLFLRARRPKTAARHPQRLEKSLGDQSLPRLACFFFQDLRQAAQTRHLSTSTFCPGTVSGFILTTDFHHRTSLLRQATGKQSVESPRDIVRHAGGVIEQFAALSPKPWSDPFPQPTLDRPQRASSATPVVSARQAGRSGGRSWPLCPSQGASGRPWSSTPAIRTFSRPPPRVASFRPPSHNPATIPGR